MVSLEEPPEEFSGPLNDHDWYRKYYSHSFLCFRYNMHAYSKPITKNNKKRDNVFSI